MLTRKCAVCGKEIQLTLPYSKDYIHKKVSGTGKWYHLDCFKQTIGPRVKVEDWIAKTSDFVRSEVSKDNICQLFYNHYNISCISVRLFKKLDEIYKGTYKGLAQPIPPHELYDILLRKMDYLDKNAAKKGLVEEQRANYDLAVAMGSYSSYKAWLTKIEAQQAENDEELKHRQADPNRYKLRGYVPSRKSEEELIDYEETIE